MSIPMPFFYILGPGRIAVPEPDVKAWGNWIMDHERERRVALDHIGDIEVGTVFSGFDRNFVDGDPPLVFETLVFRDGKGAEMCKYATWEEAEKGHRIMVDLVRSSIVDR